MILYYAPGACSLADHIALLEADLAFDRVKVDLQTHTLEDGHDFLDVNPKGYVPALRLDDGYVLTENIAILSWIADRVPALSPGGAFGPYRLLETLAFIATEIHKSFKPFFAAGASDADKAKAGEAIAGRLDLIAEQLEGPWLFGHAVSVADAYLYVMLTWSKKNAVTIPQGLAAWFERMNGRRAVQLALTHESRG